MLVHKGRIFWSVWTGFACPRGPDMLARMEPIFTTPAIPKMAWWIHFSRWASTPSGDEHMSDPVHVKVKKWLEDVIESSEKAVDRGWKVEVDDDDETVMLVDSDQVPFRLTVVAGPDVTYIAFITGLNHKGADAGALAPALREMLVKNKAVDFVKFCLMEPDDTVMLRSDLYSKHMQKDEFNEALEYLLLLGQWFIAELNKGDNVDDMVGELEKLATGALLNGTDPEEVNANLVKAGIPEADAERMVVHLMELLSIVDDGAQEGEKVTAEVPKVKKARRGDVDRYVW